MKRNILITSFMMVVLLGLGGIIFSPLVVDAADTPAKPEVVEVKPEVTETTETETSDREWCNRNHEHTHQNGENCDQDHRHSHNRNQDDTNERPMRHHQNGDGRRCH